MTTRTAANRYARALLEVAVRETADLEAIEQELSAFAELVKRHPELERVLLNPAVPVPRKRAAVVQLTTRAGTSPIVSKLLALLAERDRLILLPELVASYRERLLDHRRVVRAEVTTAVPLAREKTETIESRLASLTGRRVTLQTKVDPAIIGGLIAKVGSTVYDASIVGRLQKLREQLEQ